MTAAVPLAAAAGDGLAQTVARVAGIAVLAGALAGATALVYRWYVRERVPTALPVLVGLAVVAVYLNATTAIGQALGRTTLFGLRRVAVDGATLLVGLATSWAGTRVGDHVAADVFVATGGDTVDADADVGRMVRAVGRVIAVELPEEIDDIVGYDPVPPATKEKLQGRTFLFPRRLTVAELRDRLVTRLKSDYGVGYVDLELDDDGTVEFLALGSRVAGIGPTLPPETAAVAIRADPAHSASAGDLVQVWTANPPERVLNAEVRATAEDVVTLAVDVSDTLALDDETTYKLVTLPVETRPDREFASLLRAADETMAAVPVEADSAVEGQPLGALGVSVVAVRDAADDVEPLPASDRVLVGGDTLYVVARPEEIRRLETAASEHVRQSGPSTLEGSQTADAVATAGTAAAGEDAPAEGTSDGATGAGAPGSDDTRGTEAASTGDATSAESASPPEAASSDVVNPETATSDDEAADTGDEDDQADAAVDTADEDDEADAPADVMTTSDPGPSVADEQPVTADEGVDADGPGTERDDAGDDEPDEDVQITPDDVTAGKADAATFEELKAEMDDDGDETGASATDDASMDDADATGPDEDVPADATQADAATFEELKAEMGEETGESAGGGPTGTAGPAGDSGTDDDPEDGADEASAGGTKSFQDLKDEFESGDADWDDEETDPLEPESSDGTGADDDPFDDDSTGDDAFGDDSTGDDAFGDDSTGGDLFDDDPFGDEDANDPEGQTADGTTSDDDGREDDDGESGGGNSGGTSFADLKDEFESGDADWDDDVEIGGMALEPESEEEKELAEKAEKGEIGTLDGEDDTESGTDDGSEGGGTPDDTGGDDGVAGGLAADDLFDDTVEGDDEFGDPFADEAVDDDLDDLDELDDVEDDPLFDDE